MLQTRRRAIRLWLYAVAALIFATLLVGGATRLTESGLSITEWKPVTGSLPPLMMPPGRPSSPNTRPSRSIQLNRGMTLADFKTIFWWEWGHRLLGRVIGAAFLLPFLFFFWRGWIEPGLRGRLWVIFGLGALQGAIGWWMVASGLTERVRSRNIGSRRTYARLRDLRRVRVDRPAAQRPPTTRRARTRAFALAPLVLVLAQIYLGALVAGLRAGLVYNTWPLIDGAFVPEAARLWFDTPWWRNLFENALTAQFLHRMVAYCCGSSPSCAPCMCAARGGRGIRLFALRLAAAVTVQAALGIVTLLHQAPIGLALAHQAMAIVVLTRASSRPSG